MLRAITLLRPAPSLLFKHISPLNLPCRTSNFNVIYRSFSRKTSGNDKTRSTVYYIAAVGVLTVGLSYAAVPLYRIFCQSYGYGGTVKTESASSKIQNMKKVEDREIKVQFNADIGASMLWDFKPLQSELVVIPGETALAFYSAKNPSDSAVIGISTYNVLPFEAGQYFNKIQCFCFEEQILNPHEQVDMPVLFYIDPEFVEDPKMEGVNSITLSYTFFEAKEGLSLPVPGYAQQHVPKSINISKVNA